MVKCVFCGREDSPHKGVHFIKNDGTVNFFCSKKCRLNSMKLKRDKRRVKWTESYRTVMAEEKKKAEANSMKEKKVESSKKGKK